MDKSGVCKVQELFSSNVLYSMNVRTNNNVYKFRVNITAYPMQKKVILLPFKDCIHHHPRALFYDIHQRKHNYVGVANILMHEKIA